MAITRLNSGSSFTNLVKSDSFLAGNPPNEIYWIAVLGNSSTEVAYNSAIDSNSNIYIFGRSNSSGSYRQSIAKYDKTGVIQWQKQLSNNTHQGYYECWGTVDSSGNPIAYNSTTDGSNGGVVVTKLTSAGAITWQRALGTSYDAFADTVLTDSSGNIYGCGPMSDGGGYKNMLIKYNSSGTYQWQMKTNGEGHGVAIDPSGNVYAGGFAGGTYGLHLNKYNSSGSLLHQTRTNGQYGYDTYGGKVVCDSAGNSYSAANFRQSSGTGYEFGLIKRDSSGSIIWQRVITNSSSSYGMVVTNLAVDSSDNIYGTAYTAVGSNAIGVVAKWNSSGTLQWQRSITPSANSIGINDVKIDSSGTFMTFSCYTNASGNYDYALFKLPIDGTLTGTYTVGSYSYTYAASSYTETSYSGSDVTATLTASGGALNQSTPSNTISNTTFTNTVATI
jgi:hypothetical protein